MSRPLLTASLGSLLIGGCGGAGTDSAQRSAPDPSGFPAAEGQTLEQLGALSLDVELKSSFG